MELDSLDFTTGQGGDVDEIRQLAEDWRSGWVAGDAEALLELYADEPVLMPWGQPTVFGKDAIRPLYQSMFSEYAIKSEPRVMDVEVSGDLGYFWCTYALTATPKAGGTPREEEGKAVFIVRREHGAWKIARLIDNCDRAPAAGQQKEGS